MTDLKRIDEYRWEVLQSGNMRVPGIIYLSDSMMKQTKAEGAPKQVSNVATLPGILKASFAMPDVHQGYGFPIGGVAAFDWNEGVISPGGVGYDINCLCATARILNKLGYTQAIAEMEKNWHTSFLKCQNLTQGNDDTTPIVRYLKILPQRPVYRLKTTGGDEILATEDHPFWTPEGMVELHGLKNGDQVARYPFEGVPYETPASEILVDEDDIKRILADQGKGVRGSTLSQVSNQLKKRHLLPLRTDSEKLPYLIKLMGFVFGDGTLYFQNGNGKETTWFYGNESDLEQIRADVEMLGFTPFRIYRRNRSHVIDTAYGKYEFNREELSFKVVGSAFASMLASLGTPVGAKASQDFRVPGWLFHAPLWHQRLFLASFFGAELSSPPYKSCNYNFNPPILSINKRSCFVESGRQFLEDISKLLQGFEVETKQISQRAEQTDSDGSKFYRIRLILSSKPESLINLWSQVGFEYNCKRRNLAMAAIEYLKQKKEIVAIREEAAVRAAAICTGGTAPQMIYRELVSEYVNQRFLARSLYKGRSSCSRIGSVFETFDEFCTHATAGIEDTGMVWSTVRSIEKVDLSQEKDFDGYVYDFTVAHPDHNFIANGFVVSNCGVRLATTHLEEEDIRPRLHDLVNALYQNVPTGVGSKGKIKLSASDEKKVLKQGSQWAVKHGYGEDSDLECTEEGGCLSNADPDEVSERALERGKKQLGTLGSGNHFLEVGIVEEIYDPHTARVFGLFEGQVALMLHSGSRGLGYQICDDFLAFMTKHVRTLGFELPDRQLSCALIQSEQGMRYYNAMACAANYAWANRQVLMHLSREVFFNVLSISPRNLGMSLLYDVSHNIAKKEEHIVEGKKQLVCVHRKGATRSFGPGHESVCEKYRKVGQPILIPGDMGTASYILVGTEKAMLETFGSTCHGAGRVMSRKAAKKASKGRAIHRELEDKGILVRSKGRSTLAEEMPDAYKDVSEVVEVVHGAGISMKVAKLRPIAVVKG
ncbi:MAG: RNA-splicing ligase RtcB [Desulfobacteraceae bacterium]|nr:RNA-splicing ligase RtcB [Desulfobacteraceae bacterium]